MVFLTARGGALGATNVGAPVSEAGSSGGSLVMGGGAKGGAARAAGRCSGISAIRGGGGGGGVSVDSVVSADGSVLGRSNAGVSDVVGAEKRYINGSSSYIHIK